MVADAVEKNRSPRPNSLLTGKLTGNLLFFGSLNRNKATRNPCANGFLKENTQNIYQGNFVPKTGNKFAISGYYRTRLPLPGIRSMPHAPQEFAKRTQVSGSVGFRLSPRQSIMAKDGKSMNAKEILSCTVEAYLGSSSTPPGTSARIDRSPSGPSR